MRRTRAVYPSIKELIPAIQIGDIVFLQTKKALGSRFIRFATHSHWSHVGMVFDIIEHGAGRTILVIEAVENGVEIHRLERYIQNPETYDFGFKRFPGLTEIERQKIRALFLNAVDVPYDWYRLISFFLVGAISKYFGIDIMKFFRGSLIDKKKFLCTTFVQRSLYYGVDPSKRESTLFRPGDKEPSFEYRLEKIQPTEIAQSKNTLWLYHPHR